MNEATDLAENAFIAALLLGNPGPKLHAEAMAVVRPFHFRTDRHQIIMLASTRVPCPDAISVAMEMQRMTYNEAINEVWKEPGRKKTFEKYAGTALRVLGMPLPDAYGPISKMIKNAMVIKEGYVARELADTLTHLSFRLNDGQCTPDEAYAEIDTARGYKI